MNIKILNTEQLNLMKKAVNVYNRQHDAIAQNIAHVNDAGYQRVKTDFSDVLKEAENVSRLRQSNERHIASPHYVDPEKGLGFSHDGNNVDITQEMSELAENQIRHEFITRALNGYYLKVKQAISGKVI